MHRLLILFAALALAIPLAASAALPDRPAALRGVDFIRTTQQPGGGFGSPGQSMDAIYAIRSAGIDPNTVIREGESPADYLLANAAAATSPAAAAKAALGAKALGLDPQSVGGSNLIARISAGLSGATGRYADDDFSNAIAILGLACTGNSVPASAVLALRTSQISDGGWGFGGASDPDTTAIALQALLATGVPASDADAVAAVAYLRATQSADAGWGFDPQESNVNSTAYVLQALIAASQDPESAAYTKAGATPVSFLLSQQQADGSFRGFDAAFATNQTVPALAGRTFCNAPQTLIVAVATPTPTPSASPSPAATTTTVPAPPSTGSGQAPDAPMLTALLAAGVVVATALGAATILAGRRQQ
ncbi:MAG: prenyltransferase/squalene oxidase repeat-containing protein [Tepidiformaceae bacterium]